MEGANKHFYILFATFIVALTGLTQLLTKTFPLLYANAINLCQKTFSNVIITLPSSLPITIISVILFVLLIGVIAISVQAFKTRLYITKNLSKRIAASQRLQSIFKSLNLDNKVDIVQDSSVLSFSYGLFKPRICLSTGLIQKLSTEELKAVLLHESYHLKNLDPLKIVLSKTASFMCFFLPIMYDFQRNYALSKEIAADRVAVSYGQKESLLSVLSKLLTLTPSPRFNGVAALAEIDSLEERILHLTNQKKGAAMRLSKRHLVFSLAIFFLSIIVLNAPVHAIAKNNMAIDEMNTFYICPFGDSCLIACTQDKKSNQSIYSSMDEVNSSKNIPYTPVK